MNLNESQMKENEREEVDEDSNSEVQKRSLMKMFRMFKKSLGAPQKRNTVPMLG